MNQYFTFLAMKDSPSSNSCNGCPGIERESFNWLFFSGDRLERPFRTHFGDKEEHYSEQVVLVVGQAISFPATRI